MKQFNKALLFTAISLFAISNIEAKGSSFGGRVAGSSWSASKSSSFSSSKSSSSWSKPSNSASKATVAAPVKSNGPSNSSGLKSNSVATKSIKTSPMQASLDRNVSKQQSANALSSYKAEQSKFKTSNTIKSSPIVESGISNKIANRGYSTKTYYVYRNNYYGGYHPPYMYNYCSSYGMWDTIALWYMLDHISESRYSQMYYNHSDDPAFQQWKKDALKEAEKNGELKAKLAMLENETSKTAALGIKKDENYIPTDQDGNPMPVLAENAVNNLPKAEESSLLGIWGCILLIIGIGAFVIYIKCNQRKVEYI